MYLGPACGGAKLPQLGEAHCRALVAGIAATAASSGPRTAQDCDHLPSAGPNSFIPFLRASSLPELPVGPEPCGTCLSQIRLHFPWCGIKQCLTRQKEGKGRSQTLPVLDFAPSWCTSSVHPGTPPAEVEYIRHRGRESRVSSVVHTPGGSPMLVCIWTALTRSEVRRKMEEVRTTLKNEANAV